MKPPTAIAVVPRGARVALVAKRVVNRAIRNELLFRVSATVCAVCFGLSVGAGRAWLASLSWAIDFVMLTAIAGWARKIVAADREIAERQERIRRLQEGPRTAQEEANRRLGEMLKNL